MFMAKEKLSVEVAEIDGVEIDDVNLAEAGQDEVLEQLAANAASAYQEYSGLKKEKKRSESNSLKHHISEKYFRKAL